MSYLKQAVKAKHSIWKWCVWSYLIYLLTAANPIIVAHYLKIAQFCRQILLQVVQNFETICSHFKICDTDEIKESNVLILLTTQKSKTFTILHSNLKESNKLLRGESKEYALERIHKKLYEIFKRAMKYL